MAGGAAVAPPLPPLPLTSKKESQAYQRELHTVTVGARVCRLGEAKTLWELKNACKWTPG